MLHAWVVESSNADLSRKVEELKILLQLEKRKTQKLEAENEDLRARLQFATSGGADEHFLTDDVHTKVASTGCALC